jgi:hypothetical protein
MEGGMNPIIDDDYTVSNWVKLCANCVKLCANSVQGERQPQPSICRLNEGLPAGHLNEPNEGLPAGHR